MHGDGKLHGRSPLAILAAFAIAAVVVVGCGSDEASVESTGTSTGSAETSTGVPGTSSATSEATTAERLTTGTDTGVIAPSTGEDTIGGECSLYKQDCAQGDKCVPWSDQPDLVPDEIRCCPIVGSPKEVGDDCEVQDYFGSCLDDCSTGSFCMDLDGDGTGTCQAMCGGSSSNPECEQNEKCLIYFAGVPLCFDRCDPLIQDCQEGDGCYPDESAAGGTGFICLPTVGTTGDYGEYCWLLSNCQPGFVCASADFLPDCNGLVGCCSPLCDITEPDSCDAFAPGIECVPWYYGGQTPPYGGLEDVGACALPPS